MSYRMTARSADGRTTTAVTEPEGLKATARTILNPVSGHRTYFDETSNAKASWPLAPEAKSRLVSVVSDPTCLTDAKLIKQMQFVGRGQVLGVQVVKLRQGLSPNSTLELWKAPSLNCAILYSRLEKPTSRNEIVATSITGGEPAPSVFTIPPNTPELPPSEIVKREYNNRNAKIMPSTERKIKALDDLYFRANGRPPK